MNQPVPWWFQLFKSLYKLALILKLYNFVVLNADIICCRMISQAKNIGFTPILFFLAATTNGCGFVTMSTREKRQRGHPIMLPVCLPNKHCYQAPFCQHIFQLSRLVWLQDKLITMVFARRALLKIVQRARLISFLAQRAGFQASSGWKCPSNGCCNDGTMSWVWTRNQGEPHTRCDRELSKAHYKYSIKAGYRWLRRHQAVKFSYIIKTRNTRHHYNLRWWFLPNWFIPLLYLFVSRHFFTFFSSTHCVRRLLHRLSLGTHTHTQQQMCRLVVVAGSII